MTWFCTDKSKFSSLFSVRNMLEKSAGKFDLSKYSRDSIHSNISLTLPKASLFEYLMDNDIHKKFLMPYKKFYKQLCKPASSFAGTCSQARALIMQSLAVLLALKSGPNRCFLRTSSLIQVPYRREQTELVLFFILPLLEVLFKIPGLARQLLPLVLFESLFYSRVRIYRVYRHHTANR